MDNSERRPFLWLHRNEDVYENPVRYVTYLTIRITAMLESWYCKSFNDSSEWAVIDLYNTLSMHESPITGNYEIDQFIGRPLRPNPEESFMVPVRKALLRRFTWQLIQVMVEPDLSILPLIPIVTDKDFHLQYIPLHKEDFLKIRRIKPRIVEIN